MSDFSAGELARLRAALSAGEARLAEVEQELADVRAEADEFARLYNARVGALQAKLEALDEQVRQARARGRGYRQVFSEGYASVDEQYRRAWSEAPPKVEAPAGPEPAALKEIEVQQLRKLYRELARAHHPDLARDERERERRTRVMAEINAAYAARSLPDLRMLAGLAAPQAREPEMTPQARVEWLKKEIARVADLIAEREHERIALEHGALMKLKVETAFARRQGRDLLAETARLIENKIKEREIELVGLGG
jgi:capsule polysaccharide export protein KpsE/RkpR